MNSVVRLFLSLSLLLLSAVVGAAEHPMQCDSCRIQVRSLDQPINLAGTWLFTREDSARNKEVALDTSDWKLVKAPGPWKPAYKDGRNFTVGWYRGMLEGTPALAGQEVVLLINAHFSRMDVYVDGQEVMHRPQGTSASSYYSFQPVPVRFKLTGKPQVVAIRIDTPLMVGVYQMPFELRRYDQHDASLAAYQFWGGELRMLCGYTFGCFGLFFLMVYRRTRYPLYLMAALSSLVSLPFFIAPNDYLFYFFQPETLLYLHYVGLTGSFFYLLFCQCFYKPMPKTNWVFGIAIFGMGGALGLMAVWPNLNLYQHIRSTFLVSLLGCCIAGQYALVQGWRGGRPGAATLCVAMLGFLAAGVHDALLALGIIKSVSMIFIGGMLFITAMLYVSSTIFARTFLQNKGFIKELKGINENLEGLVEQRTQQLASKTQHIRGMLENLPQGVLTILRDGSIHKEYSAHLPTILGTDDIAGRQAAELLLQESDMGVDACAQARAALQSCLGEDAINFEFNAHALPAELQWVPQEGAEKSLAVTWSPMCDVDGLVDRMLVCIRDVTEYKRLEREARAQQRELQIVGQIVAVAPEKFAEFTTSALEFIAANRDLIASTPVRDAAVLDRLFRNMHTVKGNARTYGLTHITDLVHQAEQRYDELRQDNAATWDPAVLLVDVEVVAAAVNEYVRVNAEVLGRESHNRRTGQEKYVLAPRDQFESCTQMLLSVDLDDPQALREAIAHTQALLDRLGTVRLADALSGIVQSLPSLAEELGKQPPKVRIEDHGLRLRSESEELLRNVFAHLLRNAVDHGLETPQARAAAGKPEQGCIEIEMRHTGQEIEITLSDDGRGMAIERVRRRAVERGLLAGDAQVSSQEIAMLIFSPGFSTAEQVTAISGRGVGMDAVKGFMEEAGGSVSIQLRSGAPGSEFVPFELVLRLPAKLAAIRAAASRSAAARVSDRSATAVDRPQASVAPGAHATAENSSH